MSATRRDSGDVPAVDSVRSQSEAAPRTRASGAEAEQTPAIEAIDLVKRFGATVALDKASFACAAGEIHALLGENGAGKSTLMKILCGIHRADAGELRIDGQRVSVRNARDAFAANIAAVYQELTLEPNLTVAENLFLSREPTTAGFVFLRRLVVGAKRLLAEWDAEDLDPTASVAELALGARQKLEIVRALSRGHKLLILDEPSSALAADGVQWLFRQLQRVRDRGTAVIYVSHRMGEINDICDRVTVMRNGRNVSTFPVGTVTDTQVVEMMLGHSMVERLDRLEKVPPAADRALLQVEGLASAPDLRAASLELHQGEILGIAALQGHGQGSLFMTLFGAQPSDRGRIVVDGKQVRLRSPRAAINAGIGLGLIPEDRQASGLFPGMSIGANVSLPALGRLASGGVIRSRRERQAVQATLQRLNIAKEPVSDVAELSGGNQQKVVIARWLLAKSRILLMYDPTRGVDVGTKAEIFALMRAFVDDGGAILFYSTDLEELVTQAHRVAVLYRGTVRATIAGPQLNEKNLLTEMMAIEGSVQAP